MRALTGDAGVDIVSFGGTKNGLMLGEAVIVLEPELAVGFEYVWSTGAVSVFGTKGCSERGF